MRRIRLLRVRHAVALSIIPLGWATLVLLRPQSPWSYYAAPALPWVMVVLTMCFALCQRCGRPFFWSWKTGPNPFAQQCRHCGAILRGKRS